MHLKVSFSSYVFLPTLWVDQRVCFLLTVLPGTLGAIPFLKNYLWSRAAFAIVKWVLCDHWPAWLLIRGEWTVHSQFSWAIQEKPLIWRSLGLWFPDYDSVKISFPLVKSGKPWYHTSSRGIPVNSLKQQSASPVGSKSNKKVLVRKHRREIGSQPGNKQTAARGTLRSVAN